MANSESGESDSEEDDDGGLLTNELNDKISKTLAAIRSKKPEVYDSSKAFFTEEEMAARKEKVRAERKLKPKPQNVTQVMAQQLLQNKKDPMETKAKGKKRKADESEESSSSSEDSDDGGATNSRARLQQLADRPANLTYSQQQQQLKDAFLQSVKAAEKPGKATKESKSKAKVKKESSSDEEEEESDEEVFKVKKRIPAAAAADEDGDATMAAAAGEKKGKKSPSSASAAGSSAVPVPTGDDFLNTYLNQEWWRAKDLSKLPTYQSITGEELPEDVSASEDEEELDRVDTYESAYNFRFQEPNAAYQIKSYPREIEDSLRKEDSKRKTARDTAKKSKELELLRKKEEIKRLKAEKRKELNRKLKEMESITGLKDAASKFDMNSLLNNWDPSKHDEMMSKLFAEDDFYMDEADGRKTCTHIDREYCMAPSRADAMHQLALLAVEECAVAHLIHSLNLCFSVADLRFVQRRWTRRLCESWCSRERTWRVWATASCLRPREPVARRKRRARNWTRLLRLRSMQPVQACSAV